MSASPLGRWLRGRYSSSDADAAGSGDAWRETVDAPVTDETIWFCG